MATFAVFIERLESTLGPDARRRGEAIHIDGDAEVTSYGDFDGQGIVRDRGENKVSLFWEEAFSYSCSCKEGRRGIPCAHLWSLALAIEEDMANPGAEELDEFLEPSEVRQRRNPVAELAELIGSGVAKIWRGTATAPAPSPPPKWRQQLQTIERFGDSHLGDRVDTWPADRQLVYVIDREGTTKGKGIVLELAYRAPTKTGALSAPKGLTLARDQLASLPNEQDRLIVSMLWGANDSSSSYYYGGHSQKICVLSPGMAKAVLPAVCRTGRCLYRPVARSNGTLSILRWEEAAEPWRFRLDVAKGDRDYRLDGRLVRGDEVLPLSAPNMLTAGGLMFYSDRIEPFDDGGAFEWISMLREQQTMEVPHKHGPELVDLLYKLPRLPPVQWPADLALEEVRTPMVPRIRIRAPQKAARSLYAHDERLAGELHFLYGDAAVKSQQAGAAILQRGQRRLIHRNPSAEANARQRLHQLGFRETWDYVSQEQRPMLAPSKLAKTVMTLVREGWQVEADGKLYRQPGEFKLEVTSGIDWFELHGSVSFGDRSAPLPALLAAIKKGENIVQLGDGTFGILPEQWLKKYGLLASAGTVKGDHLTFKPTQIGLLDALLASQPQATCDATFAAMRENLRRFDGIAPREAGAGFVGELRPYQKDGLGWMEFLRQFRFGGCLADDMGLGKTIQVLAALEARKTRRSSVAGLGEAGPGSATPATGPSLVVVPRSLIFNWQQESAKFAPALRVLDHSGSDRKKGGDHLADYDLVLTTYGTLRRDVPHLKNVSFDYVILDEAQAIKNPSSESAKAVRLLNGDHRLALSGTPIQNHLGDLWSLFEFLNPGMLGSTAVFASASSALRNPDDETRRMLSTALRPFILRRTKEQVARDLPPRQEQTIFCELEPDQRKAYDELKDHYRRSLMGAIAAEGMNKSKIQILEALLRLRQAACHPGLIDKSRTGEPSAKLDMLLSRLEEVIDEGHKVLVFSQFTSFLAIVRKALDDRKISYEYLDGQTTDRQACVERFQNDPACTLFLISLKAGGLGLNLTAADYVFLMDPWWNPAIEAQAIDRAHRIGQDKHVIACRLIAKDTVEEKVLQLQQRKRDLAEALIGADNSLIRDLGREDLELLLS